MISRPRFGRACRPASIILLSGLLLILSLSPVPARAAGTPSTSPERLAQRLAVRVLADLKPVEAWILPGDSAAPARMDPLREGEAREIIAASQPAVAALERLALEAEREIAATKPAPDDPRPPDPAAALARIRKYHRVAREKHGRLAGLVGMPPETNVPAPRWRETLRGTVRLGLGVNSARTEQVGMATAETDVTRSDLDADLTMEPTAIDKLSLQIGRSEEIRFAPSARSWAALGYTRDLSTRARLGTRVAWDGYRNADNDLADADRTEIALDASAEHSQLLKGSARFSHLKGAFPNLAAADYSNTRIAFTAASAPSESFDCGLSYSHASHRMADHAARDDNSQTEVEGRLRFRTGDASHLSVIAGSLEYAFDDSAQTRNHVRRGIRLMSGRRAVSGEVRSAWFEFRNTRFDVHEDRNHSDLRAGFRKRRFTGAGGVDNTSLTATYRRHGGSGNVACPDYVEGRYDSESAARGRTFRESSTYGRYFLKSGDAERNAQLNLYTWLGLAGGDDGRFRIGPHVAANTELVLVDGAVNAQGEKLGPFDSPMNTVRYGLKAAAWIRSRLARGSIAGRYEILSIYNVKGASSPARLEFDGEGTYRVNERFDAHLSIRYYTSGSDRVGDARSSELDVLVGTTFFPGGR